MSIHYTWTNIKSEYNNNKFKISTQTWNDTFDLPDGSIADLLDYFKFIIKKHDTLTENPPVQIYPNKIKNGIFFKVKTGYKLELLIPQTMKLLASGKKRDADKDSLTMMNTINTEFSFVEVWFTDQVSKALEIEDNVNLTIIIG